MKFVYSFLCIIIQQTGSNRYQCHCLEYDFHRFSCCDLDTFCKGFIFRTKRLSLHRNRLVHSARKSIMYNIKLQHYLHILLYFWSAVCHHTTDIILSTKIPVHAATWLTFIRQTNKYTNIDKQTQRKLRRIVMKIKCLLNYKTK